MFENNDRTELSELGEFGLIDRIARSAELNQKSSIKGIGDDAAVLGTEKKKTLVTTDLLLEGIHFDLSYAPLKHLGYKAVAVNLSDIYAMNGKPTQITVSLGLSSRFSLEAIDELYTGILLACEKYNVDLVGGDTSSSVSGLTISVTAIGEVDEDNIVYRNGAKETDLICVSGDLGAAYLGLQLLEREKKIFEDNPEIQPDLTGHDYVLERQLKPEARADIIDILELEKVKPSAMLDVSDGLSSDLMHICTQSDVGCRVYVDKIPVDHTAVNAAEELNIDPTTCALNGGEDYELLFTVDIS
ncbi:MAG: thiamine-phosphate kinase, partial [Flavobacteriales bacterium]|nr:thiamine-phosphate kinase [Flavobacteriales bacterium]